MSSEAEPPQNTRWVDRNMLALWSVFAVLVAIGFAGWAHNLHELAVVPPADGTIHVVSATFGVNCGADKNNTIQWVRSACSGLKSCDYEHDDRLVGDPVRNCNKRLQIEWTCSANGQTFSVLTPSQPAELSKIPISCQ